MTDYKLLAATEAATLIRQGQVVGLGNGTTMLNMADILSTKPGLVSSLKFVSSSGATADRLKGYGLEVLQVNDLPSVDIYFDGCDQFDRHFNAMKSGGGIHTVEKIIASMAGEFILVGDEEKRVNELTTRFPLVVEIIPEARQSVVAAVQSLFSDAVIRFRTDPGTNQLVLTGHRNLLLEIQFTQFPEPGILNRIIKLLPGVVEHSLFYQIARRAVISGPGGTRVLSGHA